MGTVAIERDRDGDGEREIQVCIKEFAAHDVIILSSVRFSGAPPALPAAHTPHSRMASTLKKRASRGGDASASPWAATAAHAAGPKAKRAPPRSDDAENAAPEEDDSAWGAVASVWRKLTDDTGAVEAAVVDKVRGTSRGCGWEERRACHLLPPLFFFFFFSKKKQVDPPDHTPLNLIAASTHRAWTPSPPSAGPSPRPPRL
jgi:hypothetical protein